MAKLSGLSSDGPNDNTDELVAWEMFLEEMRSSGDFDWADEFLRDLEDRVKSGRTLTEPQKKGVRNIANKKNRDADWGDRAEVLP